MFTVLAALFSAPAHADQVPAPAEAPDVDTCQVWLNDSIPHRNASEVPTDLRPVLFTNGGCDTAVRIEVFDDDGTLHASQDELLAGSTAIEVQGPSTWAPGAYAIEITDTDRFVIDRIDFWVGQDEALPINAPEIELEGWTDGYDTWLYASVYNAPENSVLSVTPLDGERQLFPAYEWTELYLAGEAQEGERCFTFELRGAGGDWSQPTEQCVQVYYQDEYYDHMVCGTTFPFGCSNLGSSLPAGGMLLLSVVGLIRRRS